MDHVIVTNFEGDIALYRGPDLTDLIRKTLALEFDLTPLEMADQDPDPGFDPSVARAIRNPTLDNLRQALKSIDIDLIYSGPQE